MKLAFYLSTTFTVLIAIFVQDVSLLPFLAASLLTGYGYYTKKVELAPFVIILSFIMVLANLGTSFVDVLAWLAIGTLVYFEK